MQRLEAQTVTLPGPQLDRALELLASALHGRAILLEIAMHRERLAAGPRPGENLSGAAAP